MIQVYRFVPRSILLMGLIFLGTLFVACPRKTVEPSLPGPSAEAKPIAPAETVKVQFLPDGHWHSSGFVARPGDILRFRPLGDAAFLGQKAVLVHIGRNIPQIAFSNLSQEVTQMGRISFRVNPEELGSYMGKTIDLEIQNLREAGAIKNNEMALSETVASLV